MKLLRLVNLPNFYFDVDQIAIKHPHFSSVELLNYCYEIGGIVPKHFTPSIKQLGWDCTDILTHKPFLVRWCKEQKILFQSYEQALKSIIANYKPDLLYVERCYWALISPAFRESLKKEFPFLKAIILWIGAQTEEHLLPLFKGYDVIINITPKMASQFKRVVENTYCIRSGADILPGYDLTKYSSEKKYLFTFAGSSGYSLEDHYKRLSFLKFFLKSTPLQAWISELLPYKKKLYHDPSYALKILNQPTDKILKLMKIKKHAYLKPFFCALLAGETLETVYESWEQRAPIGYQFNKHVYPAVYGKEYYQLLAESQITLNLHIDEPGHGGNFRVFEAATTATCLLTDRAKLMADFIDPERDVVGFETQEEALDKFNYLKDKPALCHEIGMNLHKKILSKHTIYHRCQDIMQCIENYLAQKG